MEIRRVVRRVLQGTNHVSLYDRDLNGLQGWPISRPTRTLVFSLCFIIMIQASISHAHDLKWNSSVNFSHFVSDAGSDRAKGGQVEYIVKDSCYQQSQP